MVGFSCRIPSHGIELPKNVGPISYIWNLGLEGNCESYTSIYVSKIRYLLFVFVCHTSDNAWDPRSVGLWRRRRGMGLCRPTVPVSRVLEVRHACVVMC